MVITIIGAPAPSLGKGERIVNELVHRKNLNVVNFVRSCMSPLAGAGAGILGLTGWAGFGFYVVTWLVVSALLMQKANFQPTEYFRSSLAITFDGIFGGLLSYVLFWTLFYAIVFIY